MCGGLQKSHAFRCVLLSLSVTSGVSLAFDSARSNRNPTFLRPLFSQRQFLLLFIIALPISEERILAATDKPDSTNRSCDSPRLRQPIDIQLQHHPLYYTTTTTTSTPPQSQGQPCPKPKPPAPPPATAPPAPAQQPAPPPPPTTATTKAPNRAPTPPTKKPPSSASAAAPPPPFTRSSTSKKHAPTPR